MHTVNVHTMTCMEQQKVYLLSFPISSTGRVLKYFIYTTAKRHCDTIWNSKIDALKTISTQLDEVTAALENLRNVSIETIDIREGSSAISSINK